MPALRGRLVWVLAALAIAALAVLLAWWLRDADPLRPGDYPL